MGKPTVEELEALVSHNDEDDTTMGNAASLGSEACPSRIDEYLFLGSLVDALDTARLDSLKIGAVMNVAKECHCFSDNLYSDDVVLTRFPLVDSSDFEIAKHIEECCQAIDAARKDGRSILVHCQAGVSRAATVVIAYLMTREGMSASAAIQHVLKCRPIIRPNSGFLRALVTLS